MASSEVNDEINKKKARHERALNHFASYQITAQQDRSVL